MTVSDIELVREYARGESEEAFAALVSRHVNLVYSVALRQVQDPHLAQEVTQTVFIILARKAGSLGAETVVSGWLCRTARFACARALTMQRRRQQREHQAHMEGTLANSEETEETWAEMAPHFDEALAELPRKDHDAVVVRFLEGRSFREVAAAVGTSEAAAKMRVNRALEKLRRIFTKRGVNLSAAVIGGALAAHSVQAAPAGLAASVTVAAVNGTTVTGSTVVLLKSTLKHMAWTKIKTAAVTGAIAILTVGTATVVRQNAAQPDAPKTASAKAAGYETPEATLKTMIAALEAADTAKFAAGCTPERAVRFNAHNAGKTREELEREARGMARAFSKFKIAKRTQVSDSEVHLRVQALGDTSAAQPGDVDSVLRFKKIGSDWKFDGNVQ